MFFGMRFSIFTIILLGYTSLSVWSLMGLYGEKRSDAYFWSRIVILLYMGSIGLYTLINVVYNFILFFSGDELYLDSPGTIIVVMIYGVLFLLLPLLLSGVIVYEILSDRLHK